MALNKAFSVNSIHFGANAPLFVIAGPCVIESEVTRVANGGESGRHRRRNARPIHFQGFLRQGKSHLGLFVSRPRLEKGFAHPANIKKKTGLPILTDVHDVSHVGPAAEVCDILQIPAFLCRQTDLLVAAGEAAAL